MGVKLCNYCLILFTDDDDDDDDSSDSDDSLRMSSKNNNGEDVALGDLIKSQNAQGGAIEEKLSKMLICCGCLGDRTDDVNEIVECDGCGITVHEGNIFFIFFLVVLKF